jgi:cytochrome b
VTDHRSHPTHGHAATANHACRVLVWDLPTRLFHWLLVALVAFSFYSGKTGGLLMTYHEWSGVAILVLVLFRVLWGFWGGAYARFADFLKGPRKVWRYALGLFGPDYRPHLGHNPLGGWSIVAVLACLFVQAATGLFANDDIFTEGPLYAWVSKDTSDWLTGIHHLNQNILLGLVALHLAAIAFHFVVKHENLVIPMATGRKAWHTAAPGGEASLIKAVVLAVVLATVAYLVIY